MTEARHFPYICISGAPYERGRQYGAAAIAQINRGLEIYAPALRAKGLEWGDVRRAAAGFRKRLEAFDHDIVGELEGIAEGAGLPVEDIIFLNARTELLYGAANGTIDEGCTGVIILPGRSLHDDVLHGQNWDWRDECLDSTIVLHVFPEKGPEILTLVEAGGLARCGLNSNGIAITGNFLRTEHDDGRDGIPLSILRRKTLCADHYVDAVRSLIDTPVSFSNNVMLSWSAGEALSFEKTPVETFFVEAEQDLLVHSNHFLSAAAKAKVRELSISTAPDTLYRRRRVETHLRNLNRPAGIDDLKAVFADRYGWPHSVCRPPEPGGVGESDVSTVATVIMNVTAGELHVAAAPYDGADYSVYRLQAGQ